MTKTLARAIVAIGALVALLIGGPRPARAAPALATMAPSVVAPAGPALARGVNLSQWFELGQDEPFTPAQLADIKRAGFDHVRIPFDPEKLGWTPGAGATMPGWSRYRAGVDAALAAGLDVVVDMHPGRELKARMEASRGDENAFVTLWQDLAARLADTPSERVAIELYNEPQYYGWSARQWNALQEKLVGAVRGPLPRHLLLLTGHQGGSFDGLKATALLPDARVAWLVHFYLPYVFTHQGANWLDNEHTAVGFLRDVRYPAAELARTPPTLTRPHPRAARELAAYRADDWNAARVEASFDDIAAWAREHHVRVLCNEFGVIRANVDPASRYRWIGDVRRALEHHDIGWTVWAYTASFGIATRPAPGAAPVLDAAAIAALGLDAPAAALKPAVPLVPAAVPATAR